MSNKKFGTSEWREYIPTPVYDEKPEYSEFYQRAWEIAFDHIKDIPGMPQTPYMDEAFCATQLWIWDTCFMSLFCKYGREAFPGIESLNNFYSVLYDKKKLASVLPPENEPVWTNAKPGVPYDIQVHIADNPPLFAWAEYENALMSGDKEYVKELLYNRGVLQKHFEWLEKLDKNLYMDNVFAKTCWKADKYGYKWEGGRSGMDNTPRGRTGEHALAPRPNNPKMLWIDAICQQALSAKMISKLYELLDDTENQKIWNTRYEEKKKIVNDLYWDEKDEFYYDIDCDTHDFYKIMSIATYWTMTSEIATKERAEKLVRQLENPKTFGGERPFTSISRTDNDYDVTGRYWRGGIWLPTAYAALKGFASYGYYDEARTASERLLEHMYRTYTNYEPHTLWEAYSPEEDKPSSAVKLTEPEVRKDFCGWSALGPISIFIEFILGFHTVNAFAKTVEWCKPQSCNGKIGIKNLRFGTVVTDIVAEGNVCKVVSNEPYILKICGKDYSINKGENLLNI